MNRFRTLFLLAAAVCVGSSQSSAQESIKVGFNCDISASPSALVGQAGLAGIKAAFDDVNAKGGVLGRKLELVVRDDLGQPQTAIQNAVELVENERVVAMLGGVNSGNVVAWKNIVDQKKVPTIISMATGTDVTTFDGPAEGNYMYRVSLVDRENAQGILKYVGGNPESKKVGFLVETTGYGLGALADLQKFAPDYKVKPILVEKFGVADTDVTSQLNKMRSAGVDTIVLWTQAGPMAQVFRSMEKLNYFPLTLTSWVADQAPFVKAAGPKLAEKPIFMRTRAGGPMNSDMSALFERIKSQTTLGEPPIAQASHSYDAAMLLVKAIEQAGKTDGAAIKAALENLEKPYKGLMKTYDKPYSATKHEGLGAQDYHWVRWKGDDVQPYNDSVIEKIASK
ncbi:ABC transporter substrate-binding protein [Bradyrhizobium sp.]|uniref:ABC transporter substrate-binding protein n=1 Tax=Bradyrhizobium sp. TaxID=376 RepID=UPI0039E3D73E